MRPMELSPMFRTLTRVTALAVVVWVAALVACRDDSLKPKPDLGTDAVADLAQDLPPPDLPPPDLPPPDLPPPDGLIDSGPDSVIYTSTWHPGNARQIDQGWRLAPEKPNKAPR